MNRGYVVTEAEREELLQWIEKEFTTMKEISGKRKEYVLQPEDANVPPCIWVIKKRLIDRWGLHAYRKEPILGDFAAIIMPGGFIHKHRDVAPPPEPMQMSHVRFNVFLELPVKGGETFYAGTQIDAKLGCYCISRSSEDFHWSNPVEIGQRITLSFGFVLPREKLILFM
jgi:hypothetical protein